VDLLASLCQVSYLWNCLKEWWKYHKAIDEFFSKKAVRVSECKTEIWIKYIQAVRDSECKTETWDKIDTSSKGFRVQPWIAFLHECLLSSVYLTMVQLANVSNISLVRRNSVLPLVGKGTFIQAWPWIAFLSCAWLLIELSLCGYGSTSWCFVLLLWWQMD
jgi:hypothetical protein